MFKKLFAAGFIGSIVAAGLTKLYRDGTLDKGADKLRSGAADLSGRIKSSDAYKRLRGQDDALAILGNVSRPAPPHPWPIDPRAIPSDKQD